jgi:uncharacterized iron-regulated membrane protein
MTAFVDTDTGIIYNAKKGTKVWWHEKGHLAFKISHSGATMQMWAEQHWDLLILFLVVALFSSWLIWKILAVYCLLVKTYADIYEERFCWKFADENMGNKKC